MNDHRSTRPELFASPAFLCSVSLLLLNDWIFKAAFHNWLTGKLSDVAGLAAVTLFACAVMWKMRWLAAGLIAIGFAYWKSPYSQSVIDALNLASPFHIGRTVDFSDLLVLPVIWFVCAFAPALRGLTVNRWLQQVLAILSLVVFTATSVIHSHLVRESADLALPRETNFRAIEQDLQVFIDSLAARHNLTCSACESLSSGRLYRLYVGKSLSSLSLMATLDENAKKFLFDVRAYASPGNTLMAKDVDSISEELKTGLRARFPGLEIETLGYPDRGEDRISVSRKHSLAWSYAENRNEYERAAALARETAIKYDMKGDSSSRLYHLGILLGPSLNDRELTMAIDSMEVSIPNGRLITVYVRRYSDRYRDRQKMLANELAERLVAEFGSDRAGFRER